MDEALRYMEEAYCGEYDSLTDYAEQFVEDCYSENLGSDLDKSICINYLVSTKACFCVLKPPFCYRNGHCKELISCWFLVVSGWLFNVRCRVHQRGGQSRFDSRQWAVSNGQCGDTV